MAKWFKTIWAVTGDKTAVPDITDPSGYVSYTQGYGLDYQRVFGVDPLAKTIERDKLNQILSDITGALNQYQTSGFPEYIDATANGGTAYSYAINACVRFTDGKNYINTVASNTNAPNVSGWKLISDVASSITSSTAKTTPVDADTIGLIDSAASSILKKVTWANIKATLKTYFDGYYATISNLALKAPLASPSLTGTPTAPTAVAGTNSTQIATTAFVNSEISNDVGVANSSLVKTALNASGTAPIYACRAWVNFNGSGNPVTIRGSGNVSSITDGGVGDYTVNFITAMPDQNYSAINNSATNSITGDPLVHNISYYKFQSIDPSTAAGLDLPTGCVAVFR